MEEKNLKLDTFFGSSWESFKYLMERYGFKIAYQKEFEKIRLPLSVGTAPSIEEEIIYFNKKGIILYAYSSGNTIGRADCYFEIRSKDPELTKNFEILMSCGAEYSNKHVYTEHAVPVKIDATECFIQKLEKILKTFEISPKWDKNEWDKNLILWFVNIEEESKETYNYENITRDKIEACVQEAKEIIFG